MTNSPADLGKFIEAMDQPSVIVLVRFRMDQDHRFDPGPGQKGLELFRSKTHFGLIRGVVMEGKSAIVKIGKKMDMGVDHDIFRFDEDNPFGTGVSGNGR
jgi:hypothetical protein